MNESWRKNSPPQSKYYAEDSLWNSVLIWPIVKISDLTKNPIILISENYSKISSKDQDMNRIMYMTGTSLPKKKRRKNNNKKIPMLSAMLPQIKPMKKKIRNESLYLLDCLNFKI